MGNYFNQLREGVYSFHSTPAPAVFFKSQSGSKDNNTSFLAVLCLTNCAIEGNKKSDQWKLKDRIRLKDRTSKDSFNSHLSLQYFSSIIKSAFFIQLKKAIPFLFAMILFNPISVWAATYYISPSGSNSNSGTSTSLPWRTFGFAFPKLQPGDTLILEDGTYTKSTTGLPVVSCGTCCGANAKRGTATQPITIQAQNERKAFLQSDGSASALRIQYCSYWNIIGLHGESADLLSGGQQASIFEVDHSTYINLKRLLSAHTNRYFNDHAYAIGYSSNVLIEDSEAYYFHRHGISIYRSQSVTVRRGYVNSRNYADLPNCGAGCSAAINPNGGDEGITCYPTSPNPSSYNCLIENSISENNYELSIGDGTVNQPNRLLGSIALNNTAGLFSGGGNNVIMKDSVDIGGHVGLYLRSVGGATISNNTVYGTSSSGVVAENNANDQTLLTPGFTMTNILSVGNRNSGIYVNTGYYTGSNWKIDYSNAGGNGYSSYPSANITNSLNALPSGMGLGTNQCIVYVPSWSNMKGAGNNGADIGANIIYRYQDGVLTNQKLWDQSTGQFPCGATVTGVNDDTTMPNSSCINVHKRLNVGVNGCPIP